MPSFFVTGATGFIGQPLCAMLTAQGHQVRALVRDRTRAEALNDLGVELINGNLETPGPLAEAVRGVDYVLHLAGQTIAKSEPEIYHVNRDGSRAVAETIAAQETPPVLLLVSSVAASGPTARGHQRTEDEPPTPISLYGRSKLAGEEVCREFANRLPLTIVRPGVIFGPRDRMMLPIYQSIRRLRFHSVPSRSPPPLSYLYVDDLCELLIAAALRGERMSGPAAPQGEGVYFGAAPEHPDYAEFGRIVRKYLHRPRAPVLYFAGPMPWLLAGTNEFLCRLRGKMDGFNLDKIREGRAASWECSPAKARTQLGFQPSQPLEPRLQQTMEWYLREKWV